jgi:rod shape-determining protein MreC
MIKTTPKYRIQREWIYLCVSVLFSLFLILFNDSSLNKTLSSAGLDAYSLINYDYFSFREKKILEDEISELKKRVFEFEYAQNSDSLTAEENRRLKELLSIKTEDSFNYVYAKIAGRNPGSFKNTILINAGTNKGVTEKDAVISQNGLIGIVTDAGSEISKVKLICDPSNRISVRTETDRAFGILIPVDASSARIEEITKSASVSPGEKIFTTHFSENFPADLVIGTVVSVSDSSATINKIIRVDFSQKTYLIEDVFVIKGKKP